MVKKKDGRGGSRPGAGRPCTESRLFAVRLPKQMAEYVDSQPSKTEFIKGCIKIAMTTPSEDGRRGSVPFFDISVAAGFPVPLDNDERAQDIDLVKMLCPNPEASYLIRVRGDSMIEAGINSGDIVIVDKSNRNPTESEVAVCEFNGEYTLKHVVRRGKTYFLVPDNPNYPEWEIHEGDTFTVWGTVTYVIHKPK